MGRIAGVLAPLGQEHAQSLLERMRSPGLWSRAMLADAGCVLGAAGRPAASLARTGPLLAALEGRVYNREEWEAAESDAALLARLCLEHGLEGALARLNGDFAVAVFDTRDRSMRLGRDRIGLRPLYYVARPDCVAFASRPGALLALPGVEAAPDRRFAGLFAGSHYRVIDNDPCASPFAGINQVPAGSVLRLGPQGASATRYWELTEQEPLELSEDELAQAYRELLLDAVGRRLRAVEAPAFTLSGGMDSSSVLSCAARLTGRGQRAFSAVYEDKTYDESGDIAPMLGGPVADWNPVAIGTPDVFALVERMVATHDEPVATSTWLSHFLICEAAAAQGTGALFGGLGGDELNAGEYEYFIFHFADLLRQGRHDTLEAEIAHWARYHNHPVYVKNRDVALAALARLTAPARPGVCLPDMARLRRYADAVDPDFFDVRAMRPAMDHPFPDCLRNRTHQDIFRETAPCCLRAEDRHARHFGMDNVLPFFDHRLVEFMFRVPGDQKIRLGVTKHLLRRAMRGILPEETRTRVKKTGWNAPAHVWFASGAVRDGLWDLVRSRRFRERGLWNVPEVERILTEHAAIVESGRAAENHMMFLWQLLNMETWLRLYVDA